MLLTLGYIILGGLLLGALFEKLRLPRLLGMILLGILLGPYVLNQMDGNILAISTEIRKIALIIILTRAGLNLDIKDLKKVGRPAFLMCFVPATFEILGMLVIGPLLLGLTIVESLILGSVLAAVSPAVVVPRMLHLMDSGYGTKQGVPQMVMAGASVDDVYVIVLFTAFTSLGQTGTMELTHLLTIPTSIMLGLLAGGITGFLLWKLFQRIIIKDVVKVLMIMGISFLLVTIEDGINGVIGFSGLLAVMAMGATIQAKAPELSKKLSGKFSTLWIGAEIFLFVLLGASVNIQYIKKAGFLTVAAILGALVFRVFGVFLCMLGTKLKTKERIFTAIAYLPKATVQAAIGGLPLAMGLSSGELILTIAVMSILITAPLGAIFIDQTYKKFLQKD